MAETDSRPAWQTEELADEWVEEEDDPNPANNSNVDDITFGTRSISLTAPLPSHIRSGSDNEQDDVEYNSDPPSPSPNSTGNSSHNAGTFLIRQDIPAAPLLQLNPKTPGRKGGIGIIKDFFSPLPLERMFEPPSPPVVASAALPVDAQSSKRKPPLATEEPVQSHSETSPLAVPTTEFTFAVPRSNPRLLNPNSARSSNDNHDYPLAQSTPGVVRNHHNNNDNETTPSTPHHGPRLTPGMAPITDPRLRLFQFQYDTFTRDHLSAMVDSIAVRSSSTPSGSVATATPGSLTRGHGLSRVTERSHLSHRARDTILSNSDYSHLRSTKRVKLSPRTDYDEDHYGEGAGEGASITRPKIRHETSRESASGDNNVARVNAYLAPPTKSQQQLFGKDYVTASESLMRQIKQAPRDFSTISTVASGSGGQESMDSVAKEQQENTASPFAHIRRPSHNRSGSSGSLKAKPAKGGLYNANTYKQQAAALMAQIKSDMHSKGGGKRMFSGGDSDFSVTQTVDLNSSDLTGRSHTQNSTRSHQLTSSIKSAKSITARQHTASPRKASNSSMSSSPRRLGNSVSSPRRQQRRLGVASDVSVSSSGRPRLQVEAPSAAEHDSVAFRVSSGERSISGGSSRSQFLGPPNTSAHQSDDERRFSPTEDLNRFVSSSTASGATATTATTAQSFVKHAGPIVQSQLRPTPAILRITPQDVPALLEDRTGRMVFDKVMMKWVKSTARARSSHGAGSDTSRRDSRDGTDGDSEDPFRDIESFREDDDTDANLSVDAHIAELGIVAEQEHVIEPQEQGSHDLMSRIEEHTEEEAFDNSEEMELTSFSFDNNGPGQSALGIVTVMTGIATDDDQTTDSDDDIDGQIVETTTSTPDEWFDTDDDEAQFGRTQGLSPARSSSTRASPARHRPSPGRARASPAKNPSPSPRRRPQASHSPRGKLTYPGSTAVTTPRRAIPPSPVPAIRSALKSHTHTPVITSHSQSHRSANKTPLRQLAHRRSVSFSDGRRDGPIKDLVAEEEEDRSEDQESESQLHIGMPSENNMLSTAMSARSKRIADMMGQLEETGFGDSSQDDDSPSKASGTAAKTEDLQLVASDVDDDGDKTATPRRVFSRTKNHRSTSLGHVTVNATFLTECSFGVAHDRLVQVITDVQPFEPYWEGLNRIDLGGQSLESMARLKEFLPKLDELSLNNNNLCWLSGIPASVRTLSVTMNRLTGMTSYSHLLNLENLDISGNEIDSLRQLSCLRHLRELRADSNQIRSVDGLQAMDGLVKLSLQGNIIRSVDLSEYRWHRLEMLNVSENKLDEITGLAASVPALVMLNLDSNRLADLDFTTTMQRLRVLRVSGNRLRTLDVTAVPNLRTLYADNNAMGTLVKVDRLSKLENLSLQHQNLRARNQNGAARSFSISSREVRDVKRLYLSGNPLKPDFLVEACYNLVYLELAGCRLSKLPPDIASLTPNLRVLNLNYNFLEDAGPLEGLTRLRKLSIIGSRLEGSKALIRIVQRMPDVEMLDFRMNPCTFGWYPPLLLLGKAASVTQAWPALDSKFRRDLPNDSYVGRLAYRGLVMRACPRLRMLDGIEVSDKERAKAHHLIQSILGNKNSKADNEPGNEATGTTVLRGDRPPST